VISALATGPTVREDDGLFKGDKNPQHVIIRRYIKPSPHVVRFYGILKNPTKYERAFFVSKNL
jgi:hypothetical protein